MIDAESAEAVDDTIEVGRVARRVGARRAQNRSTLFMDPQDSLVIEVDDVVDIALHDPLKPLANADGHVSREHARGASPR